MTAVATRYMFTIKTDVVARWVGETPAGYRIDLTYNKDPKAISTKLERALYDHRTDLNPWVAAHLGGFDAAEEAELEKFLQDRVELPGYQDREPGYVAPKAPVPGDAALIEAGAKHLLERFEAYFAQDANQGEEPAWFGFKGSVVSGIDWALLRADGVVEFDGRFTLADESGKQADERVLVNAEVWGSVDIVEKGKPRPTSVDQAAALLKAASGTNGIAVAMRFESPQRPELWAAKRYKKSNGQLRYRVLSRGQFVGIGTLQSFLKGASRLEVDVFGVQVAGPVGAAAAAPAVSATEQAFLTALEGKLKGVP